jgi:hypothetical protein
MDLDEIIALNKEPDLKEVIISQMTRTLSLEE